MAEPTFAQALKGARMAAGLSQAALARRAGLTGSYISVLESRRRRPPTPPVVAALARALGVEAGPLQEVAALERAPSPVRRRLERMRRERGHVNRTRDRILVTTLYHLAHRPGVVDPLRTFLDLPPGQQTILGRLVGRVRRTHSPSEAASRTDEVLEGATLRDRERLLEVLPRILETAPGEGAPDGPQGAPSPATVPAPGPARTVPPEAVSAPAPSPVRPLPVHRRLDRSDAPTRHLQVDPAIASPGAFVWQASGDEAWPRVAAGDLLVLDPRRAPRAGELVALVHAGRDRVGVLERLLPEVRIAFPRADVPPLRLDPQAFRPAGTLRWLMRALVD